MIVARRQFLVFALLYCATIVLARYNDPNCGWSDQPFRAVGDWAVDAGAGSNWNPAEPKGLMSDTNAQSCEYAVDIHGLKPNKVYNWKVTIANTWEVQWGCVGRGGPDCQFSTPTGSIRLKIVGSFAYPLTTQVIGGTTNPTTTASPGQPSGSNSGKKVFAHYMVGFAYPSDQNFFDGQIKKAKSAGIDGFALNVGIDEWQPDRVAKALAAAKNNGDFTMFLSFDMASLTFNNGVLSRFHFAASHPNYYKVNGRPFFSTFAGENQDTFWASWKASSGFNPYLCPSWPNYPTANLLQSHPVADCIFTWNAWPAGNSGPGAKFDTTGDRNLIASAKATGKTYMAPLAPWFYTRVWGSGWSKNWIFGSEKLLPERWQQIVSLQPDFVEIITWNDYSEASYMCSISSDLPTDMGGISGMVNSPQPMHHDAWLELSKHYIKWYKNNARPTVTNDQFYWWYRTHPKNNVNGEVPQYRNDAQDCVAVHSIVKSIRPNGGQYTVMVDLNGSKSTYKITQLEQTECIPYPANVGSVTISLIGPDDKVWWAEGKNVPQQSSGNNFNAFANMHIFPSP
jgi:glucan endo-1,3-alpha-glucosidase